MAATLGRELWGRLPGGAAVDRWVLDSGRGMRVGFIGYGGIITDIRQPDRAGVAGNVVLGFADLAGYLAVDAGRPYFGALVGRFANRIADGRFQLDGTEYRLDVNDGVNTLHGGAAGLDRQVWDVRAGPEDGDGDRVSAILSHTSPAGAQGFPGTLDVTVRYTLAAFTAGAGPATHALQIDYRAETDAPTVVNLTNHSYFNLAGEGSGPIDRQMLRIDADRYLPVGPGLIPQGDPAPVDGTPFDLRRPTVIGPAMRAAHEQILLARGFDHNWVLRPDTNADGLRRAATAFDPDSGRWLECRTTEPGVQFYTGNFLDGALTGASGQTYRQGAGFTLETQHFPDTPNRTSYPSCVLRPGEVYRSRTVFRFGCADRFPAA